MGLSLNNIYQRPYVNQDGRARLNPREQEEETQNAAQKQEGSDQNARSKGLQYIEPRQQAYTPAYEQSYTPIQTNGYGNLSAAAYANAQTQNAAAVNSHAGLVAESTINIAQILKDFKNTAIAIGTPENLSQEVDEYLDLIQKQVVKENPNVRLIKSNLKNAASILDGHISDTLKKESKVVENWIDTLFTQKINFNYDEEEINERFLVKFPDGSTSQTKRQEELVETSQEPKQTETSEESKVIPITVATGTASKIVPQDKELKSLFIKAKKYTYAKDPQNAIRTFEKALNRANEIDDTETSGKIYYEVGKIYDDYDYLAQALKSYNHSLKLTTDENVKAKAHYSMAQIYDDVNQITPALDHYISTISHAGESENLPAQTASLTKVGNIYADMYEQEAFNYYEIAHDLALETDNNNLKGFVSSNTGKAYTKFDDPKNALKSYSEAVQHYSKGESPVKTAQNYIAAADVMVEYNNIGKAINLLKKAQKYARQTENVKLMHEINTKLSQLQNMTA